MEIAFYRLSVLTSANATAKYFYGMLQLQNIVKKYGNNVVLRIPSFCFANGISWVKGANGSGKTTLLKMIAGLLPFEGDILVNNISQKKQSLLYRRQVSWSEAEPLFPSFLRGTDLIELYRNIRKASDDETRKLIAFFNMHEYIGNAVGTYSAGMTKKLSLLLSFLGAPSLIILDEPFITLDANMVYAISNLIVQSNKESGIHFIISSHQEIDRNLLSFHQSFIISNQTIAEG